MLGTDVRLRKGITTTSNEPSETTKHFHIATSCLKTLCTGVVAEGMEDCRKGCGGHGYLQSSGLPELIGTYLQECTVEGENHMLTQQVLAMSRPIDRWMSYPRDETLHSEGIRSVADCLSWSIYAV